MPRSLFDMLSVDVLDDLADTAQLRGTTGHALARAYGITNAGEPRAFAEALRRAIRAPTPPAVSRLTRDHVLNPYAGRVLALHGVRATDVTATALWSIGTVTIRFDERTAIVVCASELPERIWATVFLDSDCHVIWQFDERHSTTMPGSITI